MYECGRYCCYCCDMKVSLIWWTDKMDPKCGDVKCNRLSKLLLNVCRGLGDPGSALNQQLMLANRFTRISQYFSESGWGWILQYVQSCYDCLIFLLFTKMKKTDKTSKRFRTFRIALAFVQCPTTPTTAVGCFGDDKIWKTRVLLAPLFYPYGVRLNYIVFTRYWLHCRLKKCGFSCK